MGSSGRYKAECEFDLGNATITTFKSLLPEIEDASSERTYASISMEEGKIKLNIISSDLTSLRAALNTWLRLLKIAFDMAKLKHK
ncbi:MAG: KEOPS complex subunit Pcc1 [Halobacteria archaeon]